MAKQKAPTAQELYRQRRQREEQEQTAYLPPGLINHGNTCFMNSVLQGLIATRLLSDLVHFAPIPLPVQERSSTVLASRRSPQLTNGHNLGGPFEQAWVNTMPIGDMFLSVMYKAWDLQDRRQREILSPKSILGALGQKYDQYLDFAQQDAHEFLRILLDAMRMEEQDIIKKRQPPHPPSHKKRRRTTITPSVPSALPSSQSEIDAASPESQIELSEEDKLLSFADMIFGGRLTSILVCQKCKHVSQTYEDFNDISLSIKSEDYVHRKRDRLKNLAKRLTTFPSVSNNQPHIVTGVEMQRSSSVPPSPRERKDGQLISQEEPPVPTLVRRRSLDITTEQVDGSEQDKPKDDSAAPISDNDSKTDESAPKAENASTIELNGTVESESSHVLVNVSGPEGKHVEFVEVGKQSEKKDKKSKKEGHDDGWAKLGRRLSLTVGLGKPKDRKSRSVDQAPREPLIEGSVLSTSGELNSKRASVNGTIRANGTPRASLSSFVDTTRAPSPDIRLQPSKPPPAVSPKASIDSRKLPNPSSSASTSTALFGQPNLSAPLFPNAQRPKSPKPPKPTAAETEYLRKILADVSAGSSTNPFALFRPQNHHHHHFPLNGKSHHSGATSKASSAAASLSPQGVWLGMNQFSGMEECLRMFTAVEVLDGENMVGCRRCWKIANGVETKTKNGENGDQDDEDSDSVGQDSGTAGAQLNDPSGAVKKEATSLLNEKAIRPPPLSLIQPPSVHIPTSISTPTVSFYSQAEISDRSDARSISSLPTDLDQTNDSSASPVISRTISESSSSIESTPGGLPIPLISTTAPDSRTDSSSPAPLLPPLDGNSPAETSEVNVGEHFVTQEVNGIVAPVPFSRPQLNHLISNANSDSRDSLPIPPSLRHARRSRELTDDESSGDESEASVTTSLSAESSNGVNASPQQQPSGSSQANSTPSSSSTSAPPQPPPKKPSRPKPVIMRPAFKRYLIATPPPVLVIHLKRFQQISKTPFLSFSHGFKKLDDYITFPEYLDLAPFLAPKKEDYGLGKKARKAQSKTKAKEECCMYRLYAVVVHIGNMLGGHYIAYTALPSKSPLVSEGLAAKVSTPSLVPSPETADAKSSPSLPAPTPTQSESEPEPQPQPPHAGKVNAERQWAFISDTIVRLTTLEEVMSAKAYICMYERC